MALAPAAASLALAVTIDRAGLDGLVAIHAALGALALAGAIAAWVGDVGHRTRAARQERLS
jgi:hypothetical protein